MARESINIVQQIGNQAAAGTPDPADKRLTSLMIDVSDTIETKQFRSWGFKNNTTSILHKQWAQGTYSGPLSYVDIVYPLASLGDWQNSDAPTGAGADKTWAFTPNAAAPDNFQLFTLETGDDEQVEIYGDVIFTGLEVNFGVDDITVSGDVIAKPLTTGSFTGGATTLNERPVERPHVDLYIDASGGTIGTTKITDAYEVRVRIADKFEPKWVLNSSITSFKEVVEKIAEVRLTTIIEANAQGRTIVQTDILTNNVAKLIRVQAVGGVIGGGNYTVRFDMHCKATEVRPQKDYNNLVYAYEIDWVGIHDDTFAGAWNATVINGLAGF